MNSEKLRQHVQGLHGSAPSPLHIYYIFHFNILYGAPEHANVWVSDFVPLPWTPFLLLVGLTQL